MKTFSPLLILVFATTTVFADNQTSLCTESEFSKVDQIHLECVREAEERTRLAAGKPLEICDAVNELVVQCGRHVQKCYNEDEYRQFLDKQLEEQIKVLTQLFDKGGEIQECEIVKEYEKSGRNKQLALTTKPCNSFDNQTLNEEYQKCILDAESDLSNDLSNTTHGEIVKTLCTGIYQVVHGCAKMLSSCFTPEEVNEAETLRKKIVLSNFATQIKNSHFDLHRCRAAISGPQLYVIVVQLSVAIYFSIILNAT